MKITTIILAFLLASVTIAQAQNKTNLAIVFIGNSITQGKGGTNGFAPPVHAVNYLKEEKNADVLFANLGRSGSTTLDWLPGNAGSLAGKYFVKVTEAADSLFLKKDRQLIFSMKLGTNDSAIQGPNGAPVSRGNYRKNMETIISEVLHKYPGSKVVVHHPIWYSTNTYNSSKYLAEGLERLESYIPEIDAMIDSYKTSEPGRVFKGDTKAFKYFKKHHLKYFKPEKGQQGTFYLHPNEEGTAILGKYWGKAIGKAVL
ncbi:GDSL-type esterase/lipase family protein [Dyadobacter psychrotolerans]|uniref:Lipolytic protein G-D-S-L family n=1 Tax=Dyadobacter psychrotolerans TaxID=2541721 RepID=A0A4R5DR24_9BACT|nr:GDSL-type esterase/lipase family protein [Dyadobacter psychrotolerans]TDE16866.1 lipolytic protein G-D-S-L family [Dyadobacter psychrotolerans]